MSARVNDDSWFWLKPDYLKAARQEVLGLSQAALAEEVASLGVENDDESITRETIANWETRRSINNTDTALAVYKVLALKGSAKALRAVLELLTFKQKSHEKHILELDPERVRRQREAYKDWLKDVKADQKRFKAMLNEK